MTEQIFTAEQPSIPGSTPSTDRSWQDELTDSAISYAIFGHMTADQATEILSRPIHERTFMADRLEDLCDQDTRLNERHLLWMSSILRRAELSVHATQIFTDTVSVRPVMNFKQGLSERANSGGRHSSPDTSGW